MKDFKFSTKIALSSINTDLTGFDTLMETMLSRDACVDSHHSSLKSLVKNSNLSEIDCMVGGSINE